MAEKKKIDDGGTAFPNPEFATCEGVAQPHSNPGMTLRQWYAGLAMQGIVSTMTPEKTELLAQLAKNAKTDVSNVVAYQALDVADALIAAEKATR